MTRRAVALTLAVWLLAGSMTPAHAAHRDSYSVYSRVSCYRDSGTTYDGGQTVWGVTAGASWDIPMHSVVIFPDGQSRVITDRGATPWGNGTPDAPSWTDSFDPTCTIGVSWPVSAFGDYAWLTVVPQ